jgi:hypothetical protein
MRASSSRKARPSRCYGKIRYRDRKDAKAALAGFRARKRADPSAHVPVRAYRCHRCDGGWHLTSESAQEYAERFAGSVEQRTRSTVRRRMLRLDRELRLREQRARSRVRSSRDDWAEAA